MDELFLNRMLVSLFFHRASYHHLPPLLQRRHYFPCFFYILPFVHLLYIKLLYPWYLWTTTRPKSSISSSTKVFQSSKSLAARYGIPETPAPRTKSSVNLHQSAKSPLVIERFPISELKLSIYIISKPRLIISTRLTQLQLASLPTSVCPEELCAPVIMSMQLCRCKY